MCRTSWAGIMRVYKRVPASGKRGKEVVLMKRIVLLITSVAFGRALERVAVYMFGIVLGCVLGFTYGAIAGAVVAGPTGSLIVGILAGILGGLLAEWYARRLYKRLQR